MIATILGWIVVGLVVGLIARLLHPGRDPMGLGATIVLGILGSLIGGGIAYIFHLGDSPYQPGGWIMSIIGAILLLVVTAYGSRTRRV